MHGLNAALYGRQTFSNGAAQNKNFNHSRMIRLSEMPTVKVLIMPPPAVMDRTVSIGGVGELGVPTPRAGTGQRGGAAHRNPHAHAPVLPNATMGDS